jgi:hypothetical protein
VQEAEQTSKKAAEEKAKKEVEEIFETLRSHCSSANLVVDTVRELVGARLTLVRKRFPAASVDDVCQALLKYSPESALFAQGHSSSESIGGGQRDKYQGKLHYGSDSAFHDGADDVIGAPVPDEDALVAIHDEIMRDGVPEEDRYNLWYVQHCTAVEQRNFDEKGKPRQDEFGHPTVLDEGHGGMCLQDFTTKANAALQQAKSKRRLTDAQALALRIYTSSTFRRMNAGLRNKGMGKTQAIPLRALVQSARTGVLRFQAIRREAVTTFRGVTGYLSEEFEASDMGMDFAFFSTSANKVMGAEFAGGVSSSVLFEVDYVRACPGADISMLSLFPGEKEVLFPPCTGLSLKSTRGTWSSGAGAGQAHVAVTPTAATS